jgi:surfeit locus 1 family protein
MNLPRSRTFVLLMALLASLGTARLGVWQLDRAAQKVALQQALTERGRLPELAAADLAGDDASAPAQLQRRIHVAGRWASAATVFLDNRPMNEHAGFIAITPLQLADGRALLVLRGWAPRDLLDRTRLPALPTPAGEVELRGRLVAWPSALYDFGAAASGPLRQNLDRTAYAAETGLRFAPLALQLQPDTSAAANDGLLRDWPAPALNVQMHYGYAAQWFGLCALVVGLTLWFQFLRPWLRARRPAACTLHP